MFIHCPLRGLRAGYAKVLSQKCKVLGCDVIGLQETRRSGRTEFAAAGYNVLSSGEDGSSGRVGQHWVGLAVKGSVARKATWTQELMNERLMSVVGLDSVGWGLRSRSLSSAKLRGHRSL